jgi:hypothetical protein
MRCCFSPTSRDQNFPDILAAGVALFAVPSMIFGGPLIRATQPQTLELCSSPFQVLYERVEAPVNVSWKGRKEFRHENIYLQCRRPGQHDRDPGKKRILTTNP